MRAGTREGGREVEMCQCDVGSMARVVRLGHIAALDDPSDDRASRRAELPQHMRSLGKKKMRSECPYGSHLAVHELVVGVRGRGGRLIRGCQKPRVVQLRQGDATAGRDKKCSSSSFGKQCAWTVSIQAQTSWSF